MAERIQATSPEEAITNYQFFKSHAPFRFSGIKWMVRLNENTFLLRCTKPKVLKEGQELYKIES